jgi:hypothetical protein
LEVLFGAAQGGLVGADQDIAVVRCDGPAIFGIASMQSKALSYPT